MIADPLEPERPRIGDQLADDPVTLGQRSDSPPRLLVDADVEEALELGPARLEDAERGVASAGQLASRIENVAENRLEIELGDEPPTDREQALELDATERVAVCG